MMVKSKLKQVVVGLVVSLVGQSVMAGDWYRWRGPEQNGVSRETNIPDSWSPDGTNLIWKNEIGGMSSPIVMNGKVYTISRTGEVAAGGAAGDTLKPGPYTAESYVCVNAANGKELWKHTENMTQTDVPFHRIGWSNPVGDPKTGRVYFYGCNCGLLCLDGESGKVIWKRQMTEEFGAISTFGGRTSSPTIDEDQVFVSGVSFGWGENARGQHRMYAFNKNTGQLNWTTPTGGVPVDSPQNTPVVATINGERLVIFGAGDGGVHAFQSRTGKKAWSLPISKRGLNSSVLVDGTRVYAMFDLENIDNPTLGSVVCLECGSGKPEILWKHDGIEAGFPTATISNGRLYVEDNSAWVHCLDSNTGKTIWKKNCGRIGKGSLVYVDNKLLVTEANGRITVLKPEEKTAKVLNKFEVPEKLAREYATYGTPAISNGRIFIQCANQTFCFGNPDSKPTTETIPDEPKEEPVPKDAAPALVQVVPADLVLHPGQKAHLTARLFDAKGRFISESKAEWSVGQLMMPPIPKPGEKPDPAAKPSPVGNLKGEIDADGNFTAAAGPAAGGAVVAKVGDVTGFARIRVLPPLPWKFDFETSPLEKPPLTWTGAGGKFAVTELDGTKCLVKLIDPPDKLSLPPKALYARARTNIGSVDMYDYTMQADIRVTQTTVSDGVYTMPDAGIINSRYVLELQGSSQMCNIHVWQNAMPDYTSKAIPFKWKGDAWYRLKLKVTAPPSKLPKTLLQGKAWLATDPEPKDWMIELEDVNPNFNGNPGLWGFSNNHEIFYDNILVTPNK